MSCKLGTKWLLLFKNSLSKRDKKKIIVFHCNLSDQYHSKNEVSCGLHSYVPRIFFHANADIFPSYRIVSLNGKGANDLLIGLGSPTPPGGDSCGEMKHSVFGESESISGVNAVLEFGGKTGKCLEGGRTLGRKSEKKPQQHGIKCSSQYIQKNKKVRLKSQW